MCRPDDEEKKKKNPDRGLSGDTAQEIPAVRRPKEPRSPVSGDIMEESRRDAAVTT